MNERHVLVLSRELSLPARQIANVALLLEEGGTVPFIARYRKEATGELDEVAITAIRDRLAQLADLDTRRAAILDSLRERELLTPELEAAVNAAETMTALEDIYLPYRPKRRTRATIAREKGLEPLALLLLEQRDMDLSGAAHAFVDPEKGVESPDDALSGARDIIAELVSEHAATRAEVRELYRQQATIGSTLVPGMEAEAAKFQDYFDWRESAQSAPSHRILAMFRGEKEGFLRLAIAPPEEEMLRRLEERWVTAQTAASQQVRLAVQDGARRLLAPSMENEYRTELKDRADEAAIQVFAANLRELLLAAPLGRKIVLAVDPGYRTGCKIAVLDRQGRLLHHDAIYPHSGENSRMEAAKTVLEVVRRFHIEALGVGNGTAGRETEAFLRALPFAKPVPIVMVNESGASIYSASAVAREEFPDLDLTVRGTVSIGRRLMDPLAELVKIDPKSIGVGQYQHDVDQKALKRSLDDVVISCVNGVGVDLNTASVQLLSYVAGLGQKLAWNVIAYRDANGPFATRDDLRKVPRLGPKAFEQAAGFLRIPGSPNPLDASAVHPERYALVERMAKEGGCSVPDLLVRDDVRKRIDLQRYVSEEVGLPTLRDIIDELSKPGRDPRQSFEAFSFQEGVNEITDLQAGMRLPGIVTNVTAFGAFVDIGVHQDGLVHISQLADTFVKNPADVVKAGQKVSVVVMQVDVPRKRISLSMKKDADGAAKSGGGAERSPALAGGKGKGSPAPAPAKPVSSEAKPSLEDMAKALAEKFGGGASGGSKGKR